jgi:electron transfer flavoprotein beta subunit
VQRALEDGYEVIEVKMPCVLTTIKELNTPRYASVKGIFEAYREKTVESWTAKDIEIDPEIIGLNGSPTNVRKTFTPEPKGKGTLLPGCDKDTICDLFGRLKEKHII